MKEKAFITNTHRARFLHSAGYYNRAPENRSGARFLGKRSGRRCGQGGKHSAPPAMAPCRDEAARKTPAAPRHKRGQRGFLQLTENRRRQLAEIFVNSVSSKQIVRTTQIITARPKATPFGKRTPFAAYLRLTQER